MQELIDDPNVLLGFICGRGPAAGGLFGNVRSALIYQGAWATQIARSLGFVNVEHEVLAFLVGPRFRAIVEAIIASSHPRDLSTPSYATWRDYAQALLDQRYDGEVVMDPEDRLLAAPEPLRRKYTKPHDEKQYPPLGSNGQGPMTVLEILGHYDAIVRQENLQARLPKRFRGSYVRDVCPA